ncbi:hypothetical protein Esti_003762 [Eimeria stiedai]
MNQGEGLPAHTPVARIPASDLSSLAEFIASRVDAAHRCTCCVPREAAAKTPAIHAHVESNCSCDKTGGRTEGRQPWRVLVAIGGISGSGKSTLTARLQAALNAEASMWFCECLLGSTITRDASGKSQDGFLTPEASEPVTAIGIDGFHLTRAELDKFSDAREAHRRRGAPWTFNLQAFWETLQRLKTDAEPVPVPMFDHAKKDPENNGHVVAANTRVVLVEGLYTLLPEDEYFSTPGVFDVRIFIDTPMPVAAARVVKRHVTSGISRNEEEAELRWLENDSLNADYILEKLHLEDIDLVVEGDS